MVQETWLSSRDPEHNRWQYIENIHGFNKSVKIVAGEANGKLFDRPEFANALKEGLKSHNDATVKMIFHKVDNIGEARSLFIENNKQMVELKKTFPDRVHIFWVPKRPKQHYAVKDESTVIFEQPDHKPGKPRWGIIVQDPSLGHEWENRFDEYVGYCQELYF